MHLIQHFHDRVEDKDLDLMFLLVILRSIPAEQCVSYLGPLVLPNEGAFFFYPAEGLYGSLVLDTIGPSSQWRERVRENAVFYESDLPSPLSLEAELDCWKSKQSMWEGDISNTPQSALDHCSPKLFQNIRFYLEVLVCTLPGTTCECECTFSSLKRLRHTLGQLSHKTD